MTTANECKNGRALRSLSPYEAQVRGLSDRLVHAQRPIRILDAIKWDDDVERAFFAADGKELPRVTREYYYRRPLPFDPAGKRAELLALERDVRRQLGVYNPAGQLMVRACEEYRAVIDLLEARGTPAFSAISERLYGGAGDRFHAGEPTLADLGRGVAGTLDNLAHEALFTEESDSLEAEDAVNVLAERLGKFFGGSAAVRVRLSDGIVADAAAGSDYVKLRASARFTTRDVRLLEVHEGWVHLGTTLNGQAQSVCTFLSKGPPSATVTQEGLAVLTEILSFASHPGRVRRLTHRVEGVALAEAGADFLDVYRFFLQEGYERYESYQHTARVFRGSLPAGCGPFTKDLCYSRGFVLVYNFIRTAVARGMLRRVPLLFCGKTRLEDVKILAQLVEEGIVEPPRFLPPPFADLQALCAWMCYSNFLHGISASRIEEDYARLF